MNNPVRRQIEEVQRNIREVVELILDVDEEAHATLKEYNPVEVGLHTLTL